MITMLIVTVKDVPLLTPGVQALLPHWVPATKDVEWCVSVEQALGETPEAYEARINTLAAGITTAYRAVWKQVEISTLTSKNLGEVQA